MLHHELAGPVDAPCLVLCTSLGARAAMWDAQMAAFTQRFRVLRYDMRGHGESPVPAGPYAIADLGCDVLRLMDHYGIRQTHCCGISLGGVIGQWLGVHAPERVDRLILCNTAAKVGTDEGWSKRVADVRAGGMQAIADAVIARWFTASFAAANPSMVEQIREGMLACDPEGYVGCCEALRGCDLRLEIHSIAAPTLIVSGDQDAVCTAANAEFLAQEIRGSRRLTLPTAHLSTVECAEEFNLAALAFLAA